MNTKIQVGLRYFFLVIFLPFTILFVIFIKLIRPILLIRWARLDNAKFGHFAADVEIYLLEKRFRIDKPKERYIDFFYKPELISVYRYDLFLISCVKIQGIHEGKIQGNYTIF